MGKMLLCYRFFRGTTACQSREKELSMVFEAPWKGRNANAMTAIQKFFFYGKKAQRTKPLLVAVVITFAWIYYAYINGGLRSRPKNAVEKSLIRQGRPTAAELDLKTGDERNISNGNGTSRREHGNTSDFVNLSYSSPMSTAEIDEITREINMENKMQRVHNTAKFGPINERTIVLLIQVHSRLEYLRLLIRSLSRVQSIENSLLIFSHDFYLPQLNQVVRNIDFARVLQIFYPHSIQLNPSDFPGQSVDDCPRNISWKKAHETRCRNADYPDVLGYYRVASMTQPKHHWWWKAHFVFNTVAVLRNYTGVIVFLEEDNYVAPDFLWVLHLMEASMVQGICHGCNILAPGTLINTWDIEAAHSRTMVKNFTTNINTSIMGISFNRSTWETIKRCAPTFCEYDDYNWDISLVRVAQNCSYTPMTVLYAEAPRIFHIGDCGLHHKQKICNPRTGADASEAILKAHHVLLVPSKLTIRVLINGTQTTIQKGYGGWSDVRDKQLCRSFSSLGMKSN